MSSTKNTKDNRQVVKATFYPPESVFEIPDGIDLEDETIVKWWQVKYNMLSICYVNGEEIHISPVWDGTESDFKHPKECEIISANDAGYEYDEDEEKETTTCPKCKRGLKQNGLDYGEFGCLYGCM